jgi:hypothetical protein
MSMSVLSMGLARLAIIGGFGDHPPEAVSLEVFAGLPTRNGRGRSAQRHTRFLDDIAPNFTATATLRIGKSNARRRISSSSSSIVRDRDLGQDFIGLRDR